MVDFGLVRRFRSTKGQRLPRRSHAGFRGTLRYVSLRVHDRLEQGPADDLVALFFCLVEMASGELSWKYVQDDNVVKAAKIGLINDDFAKVSINFGEDMREFGRVVMNMPADEDPNYRALQKLMRDLAGGRPLKSPYDWEDDYSELLAEAHLSPDYNKKSS
ncbi:hypothetical protein AB6A40_005414 [Gnathostoma spinigerum]|uniref:Protein kinase domain-containing protein n=1 Tax=Gnathostoma spinigerum TaxID=75299 RepID=A0ABD6ER23_9BILA